MSHLPQPARLYIIVRPERVWPWPGLVWIGLGLHLHWSTEGKEGGVRRVRRKLLEKENMGLHVQVQLRKMR